MTQRLAGPLFDYFNWAFLPVAFYPLQDDFCLSVVFCGMAEAYQFSSYYGI